MKYYLLGLALLFVSCIKQQETPLPIEAKAWNQLGFPCLCANVDGGIDTVYCHFAYYGVNRAGDNCRACCANLTGENPPKD